MQAEGVEVVGRWLRPSCETALRGGRWEAHLIAAQLNNSEAEMFLCSASKEGLSLS